MAPSQPVLTSTLTPNSYSASRSSDPPGHVSLFEQNSHDHRYGHTSSLRGPRPSEDVYAQLTSEISQVFNTQASGETGRVSGSLDAIDIDLNPRSRILGVRKCSMPPAQGGLFLLQEYLVDFNTAVPLFDAATISGLFLDCYNGRADGRMVSWLVVKIVLAIAHRIRAMSPLGVPQDTENVQTYLEEVIAELPALILMEPSLLIAQLYVGIAVILSTSSRPQPTSTLVSMALRVLQNIRTNDPDGDHSAMPTDLQHRERVFWIAYGMETEISLRTKISPCLPSNLISLHLPSEDDPEGAGSLRAAEGDFTINIFRLRAELGLFQARLVECVLAPGPHERASPALQEMAASLSKWRGHFLFRLEATELRNMLHRSDLVHIIILESIYFMTAYLVQFYNFSGLGLRYNLLSANGLSAAMALRDGVLPDSDARRFVQFLKLLADDEILCHWLSVEAVASAVVVTLMHIMHNPGNTDAQADLDIIRPVLHILYRLIEFRKDEDFSQLRYICADLYLRVDSMAR
ncbi:hypothetical protein PV08_10741 [Exophiala spinifera]|uniref:Xylanolytic transcriptional activator regulatory domain-containing protein n=1 Tax=Exophiala spinifera TaxID=91928 RepID=A0A0D1Y8Z1_9EURO|nr:uncharacterized protein PV08_10741 [Exophiala spinifera]KIW11441.1 hypothetical protein PV08_10741 [Exophiala spinifera]